MKNNLALGQYWLEDRGALDHIAELCADDRARLAVEIGPGHGTLTASLFKFYDEIVAVEFDRVLAEQLPRSFPGKNLRVVADDILRFDFVKITRPYIVAGNIPYYLTSPLLRKLLALKNPPQKIVLLMQREVVARLVDEKHCSLLSLFAQNYAMVEADIKIKRDLFRPPPKVDSQVVVLTPRPAPLYDVEIFDLIKLGFLRPRKKLLSALLANLNSSECFSEISRDVLIQIFSELKISPDARPADLDLTTWAKLWEKVRR